MITDAGVRSVVQVKEIILRLIAFRRDIFVQFCIISVKNVTLNGLKEIRSIQAFCCG